jgi:cobalt-zinc-cadmium efflux system protein
MGAHAHDHSHHAHTVRADADRGPLTIALALLVGVMAAEIVAGVLTGSLALLSDAAHLLTDVAALALALVAARLAARPAKGAMTYGLGRAEVLSAQANGVTLALLGTIVVIEGVRRLAEPPSVDAGPVLVVALLGALGNVAAAAALARADRRSLNVEGAYQHVITDLYGFLATAAAAVVILATGFDRADAIASLLVAGLMLRSAWFLLRASGRVMLEAAPPGIDPAAVGQALASHAGVVEVHDLHVWEVTSGFAAVSAHVIVAADADCHLTRLALADLLEQRFHLAHSTLQVEHVPLSGPLRIEPQGTAGASSASPSESRQPE